MAPNLFERPLKSTAPRDLSEMGRMLADEDQMRIESALGGRRTEEKASLQESQELHIIKRVPKPQEKPEEAEETKRRFHVGL